MKKVILRKKDVIAQQEYETPNSEQDELYYYVHYTNRPDKEGKFKVLTNKLIFEEVRILYESEDKASTIKLANYINDTCRLLGGYYDNSPDKETRFPIIH